MKRILTRFAILFLVLMTASCGKDTISPEALFNNDAKVAKTTIHTKGEEFEDTVTTFKNKTVYIKSDKEGQSWLGASSGGKMVYDFFMLSVYFDDINSMKAGDNLTIRGFHFMFAYSSDYQAYTDTYSGSITLADKGNGYVILRFNKFAFSCSFGEYVTDGYLYCPLEEQSGTE